MSEQEFLDVVRRARHLGYGNMMQIISREWYQHDPIGALSVGPCYGQLLPANRAAHAAAIEADPRFKTP